MVKTSKAEDQIVTSVIEAEKNSQKESVVVLETGNETGSGENVPQKPPKIPKTNPFETQSDSSFAAGDLSFDSDTSHNESV